MREYRLFAFLEGFDGDSHVDGYVMWVWHRIVAYDVYFEVLSYFSYRGGYDIAEIQCILHDKTVSNTAILCPMAI